MREKIREMVNSLPVVEYLDWLAEHCFVCGADLEELEREWLEENAEWAAEADPPTLEYWQERIRTADLAATRRAIEEGLLAPHPPYYKLYPARRIALQKGTIKPEFCVCAGCWEPIFSASFIGTDPMTNWTGYLGRSLN